MLASAVFGKKYNMILMKSESGFIDQLKVFLESIEGTPIAPILGNLGTFCDVISDYHTVEWRASAVPEASFVMKYIPIGAPTLFKIIYS